jgi:hypothetical protein
MQNESTLKFENSIIEMSSLPHLESADFHKLEEDYLWLRILFISIVYLVLGGASIIFGILSDFSWWQPLVVVTVFFGLIYLLEWKGFKIKGYVLRQNDLSFKSGLLFFSITSVPFNRIQHTEVSQSPLARLFDLAEVRVYTAGGVSSDITIAGLKIEDAHRLKDHITKLSSKYA